MTNTPTNSGVCGSLDVVSNGLATGWAAELSSSYPLEVILFIDGTACGSSIADRYRSDVAAAGYHMGLHGFNIYIPRVYCDDSNHTVEVRVAGYEDALHSHALVWTIQAVSPSPRLGPALSKLCQSLPASENSTGFATKIGNGVAFYVEPVVFRRNSEMLSTWARWASAIALSNPTLPFFIISNHDVCNSIISPPTNLQFIPVDISEILQACNFNIETHVSDIHERLEITSNICLQNALANIARQITPAIVVSFTENKYISDSFVKSEVVFTEIGTISQLFCPTSIFIDNVGHQSGILNSYADMIVDLEPPLSLAEADNVWNDLNSKVRMEHPLYKQAFEWIYSIRASHIVLAVMQPADHPNYKEFSLAARPDEILRRIANARPQSTVVPTFHHDDVWSQDFKDHLSRECPNLKFLPASLETGLSELMTAMVHEVVTFSSSTGLTALLDGTPVTPVGSCRFTELARRMKNVRRGSLAHRRMRRNLLAVSSNGYLHRLDAAMGKLNYFTERVVNVPSNGRTKSCFVFDRWSIDNLYDLMGRAP